jgi:hypothetical protein
MVIRVLLVVFLVLAAATVFAKDVERAVSQNGKASITLTDSREGCEAHVGALQARYEGPTGTVLGCYLKVDGTVYMLFDDGGKVQLPEGIFKAVQGV